MNTKLKLSMILRFQEIQTGINQYPGTRSELYRRVSLVSYSAAPNQTVCLLLFGATVFVMLLR